MTPEQCTKGIVPEGFRDAIVLALESVGARITGSWARGTARVDSDYDFYVPESRWKEFLQLAPRGWDSCVMGHVAWRLGSLHGDLIEASTIFKNQRKQRAARTVHALGREWPTW